MGQSVTNRRAVDTVIANALIIITGASKADVGLRKAASPPSARPAIRTPTERTIVIGPGTEVIAGEGISAAVSVLIHFICPQESRRR
jgi:urease subunit alpha